MHGRHVRKTIEFIAREQRCKIKEMELKYESLKFSGNMKHSWHAGAKTMETITLESKRHRRPICGTTKLDQMLTKFAGIL